MEPEITLADIVAGGVADAVTFVKDYFDTEDIRPYVKIVTALRSATTSFHEDVSRPVLDRVFADLDIDPTADNVEEYMDIVALVLADAVAFAVRQQQMEMQQRAATQQKMSQGLLGTA